MSDIHLFGQEQNRPEDFDANARGELTPEQRQRLRQMKLTFSVREAELNSGISRARPFVWISLLMTIVGFGVVLLLSLFTDVLGNLALPIAGGLFGVLALEASLTIAVEIIHRREMKRLESLRHQDDSQLQSIVAAPDVKAMIRQVKGSVTMISVLPDDGHRIQIGNQLFDLADTVWQQIRSGEVIAHYLEIRANHNPLLSIRRADDMTQQQYRKVVGVSDDGEIIYQHEIEDDIPDGDVRSLKPDS